MSASETPTASERLQAWQGLLKTFKERLAQRLWALPTVSESEKEMVFKEYLSDLDQFERHVADVFEAARANEQRAKDENDLLRSLLGVPGEELKTRLLTLTHDLQSAAAEAEDFRNQCEAASKQLVDAQAENAELRKRAFELQKRAENIRVEQLKLREENVKAFSDSQEDLKNQMQELESRLLNLRELYQNTNKQMLVDKQEEIAALQKKLLDEMSSALKRKQELSWAEEEMFAKGVAHRVRAALVSVQGQLLLTLERLGLLDPQTKDEDSWKARWRLMTAGARELSENFRAVETQLTEVTQTLDDYLHLTHRRELGSEPVSLKELVQREMAEVYVDRRPTLSLEFLSDDPLPDVFGDSELLRFVVHALLQNALEAMPHQTGKIIIALKNKSQDGVVQLLVKDSGGGIPAHLHPRLFQPFMTTKDGRQGLSLSRAKRYAELHGGALEMIGTGAQGTTFQLELPLKRER